MHPLVNKKYSYSFESFILKFVRKNNLFDKSSNLLVAISGGVDSMVLSNVLMRYHQKKYFKNLRFIYVDHGTRESIPLEIEGLKQFFKDKNYSLNIFSIEMNLNISNFEFLAREERLKVFKNQLKNGELLVQGHHLDDSLEWYLMNLFKSSKKNFPLGIPMKRKNIIRPLMCVSKKHIYQYARSCDLKWYEDISNNNFRFERNFMRSIIKDLKVKFPKILQNYVLRQRQVYLSLKRENSLSKLYIRDWGEIYLFSTDEIDLNIIRKSIERLSLAGKGSLGSQLEVLKNTYQRRKNGPVAFSGGIKAFVFHPYILMVKKGNDYSVTDTEIPKGIAFLSKSNNNNYIRREIPGCKLKSYLLKKVDYAWRLKGAKVLYWI